MDELFVIFLDMSITAAWVILIVIILRFMLKKAPRWISCALWAVPALRLVLPFSIESVVSFFSVLPGTQTVTTNIIYERAPSVSSGIPAVNSIASPAFEQTMAPDPVSSINPMRIAAHIAGLIWLSVLAVLLLYSVISYVRLQLRLHTATRLRENVFQSEAVKTPFLLGIIRPRIYLPYCITPCQQRDVLAHENGHISRLDFIWKPLGFIILCVHWFNPLVWAAYILFCRDIEFACDERVVKEYSAKNRLEYSESLLSMAGNGKTFAACPLAFGEVSIKERISKTLSYKKPALWLIIAALAICAVIGVCLLTDPVKDSGPVLDYEQYKYGYSWRKDIDKLSHELTPDEVKELYQIIISASVAEQKPGLTDIKPQYGVYIETNNGETITLNYLGTGSAFELQADGIIWLLNDEALKEYAAELCDAASNEPFYSVIQLSLDGSVCQTISTAGGDLRSAAQDAVMTFMLASSYKEDAGVSCAERCYKINTANSDGSDESEFSVYLVDGTPRMRAAGGIGYVDIPHEVYDVLQSAFEATLSGTKTLTRQDVAELAKKGAELTWSDFDGYVFTETGSGLYIRQYDIDTDYYVLIGGTDISSEPMYIKLFRRSTGESTDLRSVDPAELFGDKTDVWLFDYTASSIGKDCGEVIKDYLIRTKESWSNEIHIYNVQPFERGYMALAQYIFDGEAMPGLYYMENNSVAAVSSWGDVWKLNYVTFKGRTIAYGSSFVNVVGENTGLITKITFTNGEQVSCTMADIPALSSREYSLPSYMCIVDGEPDISAVEAFDANGNKVADAKDYVLYAYGKDAFSHNTMTAVK